MKKTTLLLVAMFVLSGSLLAAPVTEATARLVALNFWNTYRPQDVKSVSTMQSLSFPELEHMYVFCNDTFGFVVVAADDRVQPVLGYSFESPFSQRQLNPELLFWLRGYERQIAYAATTEGKAHPRWNTLLTSEVPPQPVALENVPVLCKTRWDQGEPYNMLCPYDSVNHERAVVGCVATAMAQIMKRWNHPSCGTGSHSYVHHNPDYWDLSYGTMSADFEHTTYMWELMPNYVVMGTTSERELALSTLSYHCGVAVDMMYGTISTGGSAAYSASAVDAFRDYFKYSPSLHVEDRNINYRRQNGSWVDSTLISDSAWMAMVDEDLANGRPIYYHGSDNTGGHAFVLDGSNLDTMYHFNWGWSGWGDGYYTLANLAPGSGGVGGNATYTFNHHQGAIFGILPLPEPFDTIVVYDTICTNYEAYENHGYTFPTANRDTNLRYLDTIFAVHLHVDLSDVLTYASNTGGFGDRENYEYCHVDGAEMIECPFTKNRYHFIGWSTHATGTPDTLYQPGERVYLQGNVTLYARWQKDVAIDAVEDGDAVSLWPNPTSGELCIKHPMLQDAQVLLIDAVGRTVLRQDCSNRMNGTTKISLNGLPDGVYTVQVKSAEGVYNQRVIKQ